MVPCAPWDNTYLNNWINPPNLGHQTLVILILTTAMCDLKQFNTLIKWTVPNDVYKSMYVSYTYYSTAETNSNINQQ